LQDIEFLLFKFSLFHKTLRLVTKGVNASEEIRSILFGVLL